MRTRQMRSGWHQKVNPAFVQWWLARKANAALRNVSEENKREKEWNRNYKELCAASRLLNTEQRKIENPQFAGLDFTKPLDGEPWPWPIEGEPGKAYITNPESSSMFRTLVFLKYGVTFRELVCELERDPRAYKKWMHVHADYHRFRWGRPPEKLKMKFNLTHFGIIIQGLDFGLKKLNEEELAECLDEICPCSQPHSADYLKKLRAQMIRACKSLAVRNAQPTTLDTFHQTQ